MGGWAGGRGGDLLFIEGLCSLDEPGVRLVGCLEEKPVSVRYCRGEKVGGWVGGWVEEGKAI